MLKYGRARCSSQGLSSGENSEAEPNMLGYYRSLSDLGKGDIQLQATLTILSHLRGENQNLRNTCHVHSPEDRFTRDWDLILVLWGASPHPPTPHHHISKGLFIAVPYVTAKCYST